jgi:phosphoketolase
MLDKKEEGQWVSMKQAERKCDTDLSILETTTRSSAHEIVVRRGSATISGREPIPEKKTGNFSTAS